MTFEEYEKFTHETAIYPNKGKNIVYPTLGLVGEAGEVAEKVKKILRDNNGVVDEKICQDIKKELGDVLWYLARLSYEFGLSFEEVASGNVEKLRSRQVRKVLHGSGDDR